MKRYKRFFNSALIAVLLVLNTNFASSAKQSTYSNPWGFTGLINMPTSDIEKAGEFDISANYLFRNPGFIANAHMGVFDRLEVGLVGGVPIAGFSGLAGNLKYQLIKPTSKSPTALAVGINLIGLKENTKLTSGNYLYMVLSQDFNLNLKGNITYNLFSGHLGFGGNTEGSRVMLGLDIPVTDFVNINAEYLGKIETLNDMINFGLKVKPVPKLQDFTISLLSSGTSIKNGFNDTELILSIGYSARILPFQKAENTDTQVAEVPNSSDTSKEVVKSTPIPIPTPADPKEEVVIEVKKNKVKPAPLPTSEPIVKPTPVEIEKSASTEPTPASTVKSPPAPVEIPKPITTPVPNIEKETMTIKSGEKENSVGVLKGYVKNAVSSQKIQNATITVKSLRGKLEQKTDSDEFGVFRFKDLPNGEYLLFFRKEGFSDTQKNLIVKGGETTEVVGELTSTKGSVSGKVLDEKGLPISKITISLDKSKKLKVDNTGKYSFEDIPVGLHSLTVYRNGKEIKSFDIDILAGTDLSKELIISNNYSNSQETKKVEPTTKTEKVKEKKEIPVIKDEPKKETTNKTNDEEQHKSKSGTSILSGKITAKSGGLKGVRIMLEGDKMTVISVSSNDGTYLIKNIPIGTYKMTVSKQGYNTRSFSVKVKEAKEGNYDIKLTIK